MIRLGCDIGGTFTDFLLHDAQTGAMETLKLPTTPDDPSRAILQGFEALAETRPGLTETLASLIHGTTLVINAVIERKGAPTALLGTAGFPDILAMRREIRYDIYDLRQEFPVPLVPRSWRLGAPGRILADGAEETPLDEAFVAEAARRAAEGGIESLAICFLHSYANPAHERQARAVAEAAAPGLDVSLSSEVLPEIREFERTATTVVNAYVRPVVNRYLGGLTERLAGFGYARPPALMLSGGGVVGVEAARRAPVRLAESGPVGGAIAALELGRQAGAPTILAFDMGGTTAKLCLIEDGRLPITADYEVDRVHRFKRGSGTPVAVPTVDLIEIGAGGGSVASIDGLGLLRVGPESAGAEPGPVCYGRGGARPTVTDADLALGWLDRQAFRPAGRPLDAEGARAALARDVGAPLGLSADDAAAAVVAVVEEAMASAARMHAVERGGDAGAAVMVAYGGAGPLHADGVARRLGCRAILIPPAAGVFSALGFLASPVRYEASRTRLTTLDAPEAAAALDAVLSELEAEAAAVAAEAAGDAPVRCERIANMAYAGQGHSLRVPLAPGPFDPSDAARRFAEAYTAAYGYAYDDMTAQVVTLRVAATAEAPQAAVSAPPDAKAPAPRATRAAWDPAAGAMVPHTVVAFEGLQAGETVDGPALIEAQGTTARVGAGAVATMTPGGWLRIDIAEAKP